MCILCNKENSSENLCGCVLVSFTFTNLNFKCRIQRTVKVILQPNQRRESSKWEMNSFLKVIMLIDFAKFVTDIIVGGVRTVPITTSSIAIPPTTEDPPSLQDLHRAFVYFADCLVNPTQRTDFQLHNSLLYMSEVLTDILGN